MPKTNSSAVRTIRSKSGAFHSSTNGDLSFFLLKLSTKCRKRSTKEAYILKFSMEKWFRIDLTYSHMIAADLVWFGMVWFLLGNNLRPLMDKIQCERGQSELP